MKAKRLFYVVALGCCLIAARAAWSDKTAGVPWLQRLRPQEMGTDSGQLFVTHDRFGRVFVGANGLFVFDGLTWKRCPIGNALTVRGIFQDGNRIWIGGSNEIGYVDEPTAGDFQYHSLINQLPDNEQLVGEIWRVGRAGNSTYFFGRNKLYRWDGKSVRIWHF